MCIYIYIYIYIHIKLKPVEANAMTRATQRDPNPINHIQ